MGVCECVWVCVCEGGIKSYMVCRVYYLRSIFKKLDSSLRILGSKKFRLQVNSKFNNLTSESAFVLDLLGWRCT